MALLIGILIASALFGFQVRVEDDDNQNNMTIIIILKSFWDHGKKNNDSSNGKRTEGRIEQRQKKELYNVGGF